MHPTRGSFCQEAEFYKALELTKCVYGAKHKINLCFSAYFSAGKKEGKSSCIREGFVLTAKAQ